MEDVFEVGGVSKIVLPDGSTTEIDGEVTVEKLKEIARENGIKKFVVEDSEGNRLTAADFPMTGTVYIKEYNAAKF